MKQSIQDPLREDSQNIQDLSDLILWVSVQEIHKFASFNLTNIIDLTQDKNVERRMLTIWQNSQIDTLSLVPGKEQIIITESIQMVSQQKIPHFAATQPTQLSQSINYGLSKCSFQLLVKKQQEKQKQSIQQPTHIPKQHKCNFQEQIKKYNPPIKYRSVSSHYSPQRLESYLNKNEPGLQENKKWLKNNSYVPATLQISSRLTDQEVKTIFRPDTLKTSSIRKSTSIAERHQSLALSFK